MSAMPGLTWSDPQAMPPSTEGGLHDLTAQQLAAAGAAIPNPPMPDGSWNPGPPPLQAATSQMQGIQSTHMSPVSPLEPAVDGSVPPTLANSTSSSCEESWGNIERDDADNDIQWDQSSDDAMAVPKLEPAEDEVDFDDLRSAPTAPATPSEPSANGQQQTQQGQQPGQQAKQKRPRGRPRKHPLTPVVNTNKVTKGRSKTGCITCRKRKKKCDEAKPRCKYPSLSWPIQ